MNDDEKIVKHLEFTQGVINRLGHDSFLIKGWSMTILAAGIIFIVRSDIHHSCIILSFIIPVIGFWILDGYFLSKERRFIAIYNEVRILDTTDFLMNPEKHKNKPNCGWLVSMFSAPLIIFYIIEIGFVVGIFFIMKP